MIGKLFGWLKPKYEPPPKSGLCQLLENVAEEKEPQIRTRWSLNYLYVMDLHYGDIRATLTRNTIRNEWNMEVWSREADCFLHYAIDPTPPDAILFLMTAYDLDVIFEEAFEKQQKRDEEQFQKKQDVLRKYGM